MKHPLAITIATALAACAIAGAAPLKPEQVPAESSWFLHLDLDGLRTTETGKQLVTSRRTPALRCGSTTARNSRSTTSPASSVNAPVR